MNPTNYFSVFLVLFEVFEASFEFYQHGHVFLPYQFEESAFPSPSVPTPGGQSFVLTVGVFCADVFACGMPW